jgi:hypothetical protein
MRAIRSEEFGAIQRESTQVLALLRKALFSLRLGEASSPVQGGFSKSPSPSGGASGWGLPWVIRPRSNGTIAYHVGAGKVTDRRNSRLRWYLRHCG